MKKFVTVFVLVCLCVGVLVAEDYFAPRINEELVCRDSSSAEYAYIQQNGTYLSGNDKYSFYFVGDVKFSSAGMRASATDEDYSSRYNLLAIIYNGKCYYTDFSCRPLIDFSIITSDPTPVISVCQNDLGEYTTCIIAFNGSTFVIRSMDVFNGSHEPSVQKFYELNGKQHSMWFQSDYSSFAYIDGAYVFYTETSPLTSFMTDDRVRLRTANSGTSNTIRMLAKDEEVRVLFVDPEEVTMGGEKGHWVLVSVQNKKLQWYSPFTELGWTWSGYISDFSFAVDGR